MEDVISIEEAAAILGISAQHVRRLAKNGAIEGRKMGRPWALSRASVLRYKAKREAESKGHNAGKATGSK